MRRGVALRPGVRSKHGACGGARIPGFRPSASPIRARSSIHCCGSRARGCRTGYETVDGTDRHGRADALTRPRPTIRTARPIRSALFTRSRPIAISSRPPRRSPGRPSPSKTAHPTCDPWIKPHRGTCTHTPTAHTVPCEADTTKHVAHPAPARPCLSHRAPQLHPTAPCHAPHSDRRR